MCVSVWWVWRLRAARSVISDMIQDARTNSSSVSSSPRPDPVKELWTSIYCTIRLGPLNQSLYKLIKNVTNTRNQLNVYFTVQSQARARFPVRRSPGERKVDFFYQFKESENTTRQCGDLSCFSSILCWCLSAVACASSVRRSADVLRRASPVTARQKTWRAELRADCKLHLILWYVTYKDVKVILWHLH